jgi:hypothetical protein
MRDPGFGGSPASGVAMLALWRTTIRKKIVMV